MKCELDMAILISTVTAEYFSVRTD